MTVYVVEWSDWDSHHTIGIYTTRELAEAARPDKDYDIIPFELDVMPPVREPIPPPKPLPPPITIGDEIIHQRLRDWRPTRENS